MNWFWLALIFAFLSSINVFIYKTILKECDEYLVGWLASLLSLPVLTFIVGLFYSFPRVDYYFGLGIMGTVTLNLIASIFSFRAIKLAEISLLAPMAAFNPVFTTLIASLTLREMPGLRGWLGILVIVTGAYLLNLHSWREGLLMPWKKLLVNRGVVLILICYFIWGVTPIFEKLAIQHTEPQVPPFVSLVAGFFLGLGLLPVMLKKSKHPWQQIKEHWRAFLVTGLLGGLAAAAAFTAFSLTYLGYATAVFKLSMIFAVLWGHWFLKEAAMKEKLLASMVMFIGVLLLIL